MYSGVMGKLLRVNLTDGTLKDEELHGSYIEKYIGGDGIAARILYDEVPPGIGALEPGNKLVISAGPLAGTSVQASCNVSVAAKSPVTGFTVYDAHSNGNFARMLKFAGYDAIVVEGASEEPVNLVIDNGKAQLLDASLLWGRDTVETQEILRRESGKSRTSCLCIGPAGENGVMISSIVNDGSHVAGRGGLGAVMGAKRLKAIAIGGDRSVPIAHPGPFAKLAREWRRLNMQHLEAQAFSKFGTAALVQMCYTAGDLPIKNWGYGTLKGWEKLTGEYVVESMFKRDITCPGCTIRHGKLLNLKNGAFEGECESPEYELMSAMGSNIGVTDPTVVARLTELADRLGLDGLGMGNGIALLMECYEKGLISAADVEGLEATFGNYEVAWKLIERTAKREGIGRVLAEGPLFAARYIGQGAEDLVVQVKGMPLPMHDHRSAWGYALQYAVGSAGPAHEGGPLRLELTGELPRFSVAGKAEAVIRGQEARCFINTLGICAFGTIGVPLAKIVETLAAATGLQIDEKEARMTARRVINLRRGFNIRHGLRPEDDTLPHKYTAVPLPDGGSKGRVVPIKAMIYDYYRLMGWDSKTGKPYRSTLSSLGLEEVIKDLWGY